MILISSFFIKNTSCCLMSINLKFGTSVSINNLILSLFILNKLQSRRTCGSSSILRQGLHSRSSFLSFLYLPLSISRVCPLISPSFYFWGMSTYISLFLFLGYVHLFSIFLGYFFYFHFVL